jgi:excisionase family DNA binding protein
LKTTGQWTKDGDFGKCMFLGWAHLGSRGFRIRDEIERRKVGRGSCRHCGDPFRGGGDNNRSFSGVLRCDAFSVDKVSLRIIRMQNGYPDLLTTQQAAEILHVTPLTVKRWIYTGKLSATRIGRRLLIDAAGVRQQLARNVTYVITREPARIPTDLDPVIAEPELTRLAETVVSLLETGGWQGAESSIDLDGIKKVLRGDERPGATFWRWLVRGVERLQAPVEPESSSDEIASALVELANEHFGKSTKKRKQTK